MLFSSIYYSSISSSKNCSKNRSIYILRYKLLKICIYYICIERKVERKEGGGKGEEREREREGEIG